MRIVLSISILILFVAFLPTNSQKAATNAMPLKDSTNVLLKQKLFAKIQQSERLSLQIKNESKELDSLIILNQITSKNIEKSLASVAKNLPTEAANDTIIVDSATVKMPVNKKGFLRKIIDKLKKQ